MIFIKSIGIENFGPINKNRIDFRHQGVNLIKGLNGSGKTQTIGAILFSILGKSVVNMNVNSNLSSKVRLELSDDKNIQEVISTLTNEKKEKHLLQETNPIGIDFQSILKDSLVNKNTPSLYFDNYQVLEEISQQTLLDFEKRFPDLIKSNGWRYLKDNSFKEINLLSEGARYLFKLISFYFDHQKSIIKLPLIIDNLLSLVDSGTKDLMYALLFELGKTHQVIYTGFESPDDESLIKLDFSCFELPINKEKQISPINYNYNLHYRFKQQVNKKKKYQFYLQDIFDSDENINVEFKEVKGKNPKSSIKSIADQYIVAYLNSINNKVGRIFWGVNDESKLIVGVKFTQADRDDLRKSLTELFLSIKPEINPSAFSILFHQIYNKDKAVDNLFLLEIVVPPIHSKYLYSTAKGEVYIKTDAGKKKMNIMQIQLELEERIKADNKGYT